MKVGDFVQYRSAMGHIMGYALIIKKDEYWTIILDQSSAKEVYWSDDLMRRVV